MPDRTIEEASSDSLTQARAMVEQRLAPVADLIAFRERRKPIMDELAEIDRLYALAYRRSTNEGWTADDLGRLDCPAPEKRPPGRPRLGPQARRGRPSTVGPREQRQKQNTASNDGAPAEGQRDPAGP